MALSPEIVTQILNTIEPDIRAGFKESFRPISFGRDLHGAGLADAKAFATSDVLVAVPWVFRAQHVGDFIGVPATYIEFELRGATFVQVAEDDPGNSEKWGYFRYIDYIGALQQLGVTTTTRPALTAAEYVAWSEHRS